MPVLFDMGTLISSQLLYWTLSIRDSSSSSCPLIEQVPDLFRQRGVIPHLPGKWFLA